MVYVEPSVLDSSERDEGTGKERVKEGTTSLVSSEPSGFTFHNPP